jgi:hypothetical protein
VPNGLQEKGSGRVKLPKSKLQGAEAHAVLLVSIGTIDVVA